MDIRIEYTLPLIINKREISRVIIDQHYKKKHPEINDELILNLVSTLRDQIFAIEEEKDGFQYFVVEPVVWEEKSYRLVLLLYIHDDYLGVINAFRVRRKK